jgi:hypothetical protein
MKEWPEHFCPILHACTHSQRDGEKRARQRADYFYSDAHIHIFDGGETLFLRDQSSSDRKSGEKNDVSCRNRRPDY